MGLNMVKWSLGWLDLARGGLIMFLVTFTFQIRSLVPTAYFYESGNFDNYANFFVYCSDIFLVFAVVCWGISLFKGETNEIIYGNIIINRLLQIFILFVAISLCISGVSMVGVLFFSRIVGMYLVYLMIVNELIPMERILYILALVITFQAVIGIIQVIGQKSLGFRFLGEPVISNNIPGVAKLKIGDQVFLRAYGTMLNPNILAGCASVIFLLSCGIKKIPRLVFAILLTGILATLPLSAIFAVMTGFGVFIIYSSKKSLHGFMVAGILVIMAVGFTGAKIILDKNSVDERIDQAKIGLAMMSGHPLGVGPGLFTSKMVEFTEKKMAPWEIQPVHNLPVLIATEAGWGSAITGIAIIIFLVFFIRQKSGGNGVNLAAGLTAIVILSMTDHYFWTSYQGLAVIFIYLGIASSSLRSSMFPRRKSFIETGFLPSS